MPIFIITDLFFLIISILLAIHFAFEGNSPMNYCFIMIAYLLARLLRNDTVGA
jgi:hypothetical protein